jgi:hypothetical protein
VTRDVAVEALTFEEMALATAAVIDPAIPAASQSAGGTTTDMMWYEFYC